MFKVEHTVGLFDSADTAIKRAQVMARHRVKDKRTALANLRREQAFIEQQREQRAQQHTAPKTANATDADGDDASGDNDLGHATGGGHLSAEKVQLLRAEVEKLQAVTDRMLLQLSTIDITAAPPPPLSGFRLQLADDTSAERRANYLLPHLAATVLRLKAALPSVQQVLAKPFEALLLAMAFATVVHDEGSVSAVDDSLADAIGYANVESLRLRALHSFATEAATGDNVANVPVSLAMLALATPSYRSSIADLAANVPKAVEAYRASGASEGDNPCMRRMSGTLPALCQACCRSGKEPLFLEFMRGMVVPNMIPHLDLALGSAFDSPASMHRLLYVGTLRPELSELVRGAEAQATALASELFELQKRRQRSSNEVDDDREAALLERSAACVDVADIARTLLYRVLLAVEHFVNRRRNLASTEDAGGGFHAIANAARNGPQAGPSAAVKDAAAARAVDQVFATSAQGAAQTHRTLLSLIEKAAEHHNMVLAATMRTVQGHEVYELQPGGDEDVNAPSRISLYTEGGRVFMARHRRAVAPSPSSFKVLNRGVAALFEIAQETFASRSA